MLITHLWELLKHAKQTFGGRFQDGRRYTLSVQRAWCGYFFWIIALQQGTCNTGLHHGSRLDTKRRQENKKLNAKPLSRHPPHPHTLALCCLRWKRRSSPPVASRPPRRAMFQQLSVRVHHRLPPPAPTTSTWKVGGAGEASRSHAPPLI